MKAHGHCKAGKQIMKVLVNFAATIFAAISLSAAAEPADYSVQGKTQLSQTQNVSAGFFIVKFKDKAVHHSLMQTPETNTLLQSQAVNSLQLANQYNVHNVDRTYGESVLNALPLEIQHVRSLSLSNDLIKVSLNGQSTSAALLELIKSERFEFVEPQRIYYPADFDTSEYNDELYGSQHYFGRWSEDERGASGFAQLRNNTVNNLGRKVRIAVIDTGSYQHEDVDFSPGYDFVTYEGVDDNGDSIVVERDDDPTDEYTNADGETCNSGHGLSVASIIAAKANNGVGIVGVLDSELVDVVPVRALGCAGGSNVDILEAVLWAAGESIPGVPDIDTPVDIVNMSLGGGTVGGCPEYEQEVFDRLNELGVTVVVAAGNESINAIDTIPSACTSIIAVGSTDESGDKADFSNYGDSVDLVTFGSAVTTARLSTTDNNQYSNGSGTSFSAPMVAASAASLLLKHPTLSPQEIEAILKSNTIDNSESEGAETICGRLGCGRGILQAQSAITAIDDVLQVNTFDVAHTYDGYESDGEAAWVDAMSGYVDACELVTFTWGNLGTPLDDISYNLFLAEGGALTPLETVALPQKAINLPDGTSLAVQACHSGGCGESVVMPLENIVPPPICI